MAANTVEDLYTQVLGRAPDEEGLNFWQNAFGTGPVTADQQASFMQAAQGELAKRPVQEQALLAPKVVNPTATGVSNQAIVDWFQANPNADDATIAKTMKETGVTPQQVAAATGTNVNDVTARYNAATGIASLPINKAATTTAQTDTQNAVQTAAPAGFNPATALDLKNGTFLTPTGDIVNSEGNKVKSTASADTLNVAKQILGQNLTSKWQGEGFGSAQANAVDMANILTGIGVKNIKDFGQVPLLQKVNVIGKKYDGQDVQTSINEYTGEETNFIQKPNGKFDEEGNQGYDIIKVPDNAKVENVYGTYDYEYGGNLPVDQSKVIKDAKGNPVIKTNQLTYGNVKTGENVPNTYSERQTGNAFGGTFAGKGNTGYRVQFAPDGTPIFYTTGASSNTLLNMLQDNPLLNTVANVAASYFGGPLGVAALHAAEGQDLKDIAKAAALSYLGNQAGSYVSGMEGINDVLGDTGTKIAANTAKQIVGSGGKTDIVDALLSSAGGVGLNEVLSQIPDFNTFDPAIQNIISKTVLTELLNNGGGSSGGTSGGTSSKTTTGGAKTTTTPTTQTATAPINNVVKNAPDLVANKTATPPKVLPKEIVDVFKPPKVTPKEIEDIVTGTATPKTTTSTRTTSSGGSSTAKTIASLLPAVLGATATPTAKTAAAAATNPAVDAIASQAQQQQAQQNALLNLMSSSKDELAKIKSYKDLYGHELFEDNYVPPSAGGSEEEFFNGGHVDDLSVDALLHILRN